jgi:hypothetical protein
MNLQHIPNTSIRKSDFTIALSKTGLVSFSKSAVRTLGLHTGSKIKFLQDLSKPKDWYIAVGEGDNELRRFSSNNFGFNASSICVKIKESLDFDTEKSLRLSLGSPFEHEGITLVALLTAKITS